jgi:hypothetical protein
MKVEGRCHCGQITYEAIVDPEKVTICHCTDCQTLTGSAYRASVQVPREAFFLRAGQPKVYVKTADSGTKRVQAFCPDCGAPVYSSAISDPPTYSLRVGCLQQRGVAPEQADMVRLRTRLGHGFAGRRAVQAAVIHGHA